MFQPTDVPAQQQPERRTERVSLDRAERGFDKMTGQARGLTLTPPKRLTAKDGAGFLGGLLLYVLALNYLRYGPDGVKGWIAAKFVNRPYLPPSDTGADGIDSDVDESEYEDDEVLT